MEDQSNNKMVFSYQKPGLYLSCLTGLSLLAFSLYVLMRDNMQRTTIILASITAIMSLLLALRYFARTREKIILTDHSIQWVRFWKTIEIPLTTISGLDSYIAIDGTGLEVKAQTGQKIRFTTEIAGFWALSRELKNHLFVSRRNA